MTKEQIMRRLDCSEQYALKMIQWAENEQELRILVAQKNHELQTRDAITEFGGYEHG